MQRALWFEAPCAEKDRIQMMLSYSITHVKIFLSHIEIETQRGTLALPTNHPAFCFWQHKKGSSTMSTEIYYIRRKRHQNITEHRFLIVPIHDPLPTP